MTIARRILLMLVALAAVAALPAGAPSGGAPSQAVDLAAMHTSGCCGSMLERAMPCNVVCPSGATVAIGSGLTLPVLDHAGALVPWSARAMPSLARAPDTTPPKHFIV